MIADLFAVEVCFVITHSADVQSCGSDFFSSVEILAEERHGIVFIKILLPLKLPAAIADPFAGPFRTRQHGGFEPLRCAPGGGFTGSVVHSYAPPVAGERAQWRAVKSYMQVLCGNNFP